MKKDHSYLSPSELLTGLELVGVSLITLACLLLLLRGDSSVAWFSALALLIGGLGTLTWALGIRQGLRAHSVSPSKVRLSVRGTEPEAELPPTLRKALAELTSLPDDALLRVAQGSFPEQASRDLETLNLKQQREGLSPSEETARTELLEGYERVMLLRAEAARLLTERGHDDATLLGDG